MNSKRTAAYIVEDIAKKIKTKIFKYMIERVQNIVKNAAVPLEHIYVQYKHLKNLVGIVRFFPLKSKGVEFELILLFYINRDLLYITRLLINIVCHMYVCKFCA